jgi:hypothetical protein
LYRSLSRALLHLIPLVHARRFQGWVDQEWVVLLGVVWHYLLQLSLRQVQWV